ncbi:MAG: maleylpyruvate isomerase N-terminal domain-containing protein [Actinomycetota bacterium]
MADYATAYRDTRQRVAALVRGVDDDLLAILAPATPEWRVRDVLAHLVGVSADIVTGNLDGAPSDRWTTRQVGQRRDAPLDEMLAEWDERGPAVEAMARESPDPAWATLLSDAATHEHDIRGALDAPDARDSDALAISFELWVTHGIAVALTVETDAGTFTSHDGGSLGTVRAERFELFRAMTGRRSVDQMAAYHWSGAAQPEALVAPLFTARPTPLVE